MKEILSVQDLEKLKPYVNSINSSALKFDEQITKAINLFETNEIVQQFYNSGKYGQDIKEKLWRVGLNVKKFVNGISEGDESLVALTNKYINNQIELLNNGSQVYSRQGSIDADRRELLK